VAELWDTTLRLLSQEPLAERVAPGRLLELASVLDRAGFACLEVSGGGCFDWCVEKGVESPWERIRALDARCETPLAVALRGRFLVGSRPVPDDLVRRFVLSAADSGIDVFRIHDPLNDVTNLAGAIDAVHEAGKDLVVGLIHDPATGGSDDIDRKARQVAELGASRVVVADPAGSLDAAHARSLVERLRAASGLPVGVYCQGAAGRALSAALEAARGGGSPIACTIYPVAITLYRPSAEALSQSLAGIGLECGVDADVLWAACELVDEALGDAPVAPLSPRDAVRAARHGLPVGLVASLDDRLRYYQQADRLDELLDELLRIRSECGWPPLQQPIGDILGAQALIHLLSAQRWQVLTDEMRLLIAGRFGEPPREIDPAVVRCAELLGGEGEVEEPIGLEQLRDTAQGLATSDEELLLLALFGERAEPLLRTIRARAHGETLAREGVAESSAQRIRELIDLVQESGIGEVTIEEGEMRVTVRRSESRPSVPSLEGPVEVPLPGPGREESPGRNGYIPVLAPMVGVFYRSPQPGAPPFVEIGDTVAAGQTLCLLEAMKLFNEVKADLDGVVRAVHVDNEEPVEYGQLLFEIEPIDGRPVDAI
jgi:oxaloacetate decarboxylase alpha subunit